MPTTGAAVSDLPTIDLSAPDEQVANDLLRTYTEVGFALVRGHGIGPDLFDELFAASAKFAAQPLHRKMAIALNELHRGYIPIGTSTDVASEYEEVTSPNQSESFVMMREAGPDDPDVLAGAYLAGPNQWPELDGFRSVLEAYHEAMEDLARRMIGLFAVALCDIDGVMEPMFERPTTWLRLLRYPAPLGAPSGAGYGSAPHRDFGAITLLAQSDVPGLEVLHPDGRWILVEPEPDAIVLNTGEVMHRWSNGRLRKTPHRVINRSGKERYSAPFFFDPNVSAVVEPLPCCVGATNPPQFVPVRFGDFLRSELEAGYDRHRTH